MKLSDVTEDFLRSLDIHTVLPQQDPFVMVGRLIRFAPDSSTTETIVGEDAIFTEDGFFTPCGILENIAQTCAARIGFYNKYILGRDVQIGYIGAVRDFVVRARAEAGSTITTTVDVIEEVFGMTLAEATVRCCEAVIATGRVKLATAGKDM